MKRSASRGMCSPRSAKCSSISASNKRSSGSAIVAIGVTAIRVRKSGRAISQSGGARSTIKINGRPLSCAAFQPWNSSSSSARSAWSTTRPPTRPAKLRASRLRPDRLGPVRSVALTGHRLHLRKCSKASRLQSETISRDSPWLCGQSSGSAICSRPAFTGSRPAATRRWPRSCDCRPPVRPCWPVALPAPVPGPEPA